MMTLRSLRWRYASLLVLRWLPVGLIAPLMVLVVLERGVTLAQLGLVLGAYSLVTLLAELPTGGLADAYGRRNVLFGSSVLMAGFLTGLLVLEGPLALTLAAMIGGASRALDSGPLEAWFVDTLRVVDPTADTERELARGGAVDGVALAVGALAGGFLGSASGGQLDVVVAVALVAQLMHAGATRVLMTEDLPMSAVEETDGSKLNVARPNARDVIVQAAQLVRSSPVLQRLLIAGTSVGVALVSIENLFQVRFSDLLGARDSTTALLGVLLAASFGASAVGAEAGTRLRRQLGWPAGKFLAVVVASQGAAFGVLAIADGPRLTATGMILVYALLGVAYPIASNVLHDQTPSDSRTTVLSAQSLSLQLGAFAGAVTLTPLAAAWSIPGVWALAGALIATAAFWYRGVS